VQQRRRQRRGPLRRVAGGRRAEPVREPHRAGAAGDGAAEQPEREQYPADHAVAAGYQAGPEAHQAFGRLDGARQVAARAARRKLRGPVMAGQPWRLLGRGAEPGEDARAVVQSGPGQRAEHRGGIPPAHDPDIQAARHDPAASCPALRGRIRFPGTGHNRVWQPDGVGWRDGDYPRLGNGVAEFQVDRVREGSEDLTVTARAEQQVAGRKAGHADGQGNGRGAGFGRDLLGFGRLASLKALSSPGGHGAARGVTLMTHDQEW
jgi:hypothetical protein